MHKIFFLCGESSGDMHAAGLLNELYKMIPPAHFAVEAIGGSALENAGARIFFNCKYLGSMGMTEVINQLSMYLNLEKELLFRLGIFRPDVLILVDFPGFNLRITKKVKKILPETKIVYYFPPQVWAWAQWRTKILAKCCDLVLCGFPFEEDFHKSRGVNAFYVGNPLVSKLPDFEREEVRKEFGISKNEILVGIFPGSRSSEIHYMLPVLLKGAELLKKDFPNVKFLIAKSETVNLEENNVKILPPGNNYKLLCVSDIVWLTSGTVTLEAALYKTPMILGYKGNYLNYLIYLLLKKVSMIGLPNIICGERIVPELIQNDATAENFIHYTKEILKVPGKLELTKNNLKKVKEKLGDKNASQEAALKIRNEFMPEYKVFVMK